MASTSPAAFAPVAEGASRSVQVPDFEAVYDQSADYVWRALRRLGVDESAAEDVFQEVFLVVHRRLHEFEGRSSLRTWIFGILLRVVRNHKRALGRRRLDAGAKAEAALERAPASDRGAPDARVERAEAVRLLHEMLDCLDDDKREVFVMAELEQLSGAEIATVTGLNQRTVYARLKAARHQFNQAVARLQARRAWRTR
ncbi:MAG: RNA polymerase sigma factor [Polyangiaceae bacterium]